MGKGILGIHKGLFKKKQNDLMERATEFKKEYNALANKHRLDFVAELSVTPSGVIPVLRIRELDKTPESMPQQGKPWSEAKRENLETRKACEHENDGDKPGCKKCNIPKEYWGKGGKGVTDEYIKREEAAIENIRKQEEENAAEDKAAAEKK